ncbi:MAG: hypothetical protein ACOC8F_00780 [Planctomycetota bacterium]
MMRIDPTQPLTPQQQTGQTPATESHQAREAQASGAEGVSMRRQYGKYIRTAQGADEIDAAAVDEARRLLEAGELDTPDRARRAAQAMLERGI